MPQGSRAAPPSKRRTISDAAKQQPPLLTHHLHHSHSHSHSHRGHGVVQLPRAMVSRAAAIPPPINPNYYSYVGVSRGVYYVKDKDKDKPGTPSTPAAQPSSSPEPKPGTSTLLSKLSDDEPLHSHPFLKEPCDGDGTSPSHRDDDAISYLSYIDPPETVETTTTTVSLTPFPISSPPSTSASTASGFTSTSTTPRSDTDEPPLLVYVDNNFDSSPDGEEFARSVSPMRYARPGSDGTVGSSGESAEESDYFSDVDDPYKYNKRRSRRRGRTRTMVPVGGGDDDAGARASGSVRPKSVERYIPHQYQPQRFHSVTGLVPVAMLTVDRGADEPLSPASVTSLSPMRYAKRSSVEVLDDDSPISPVSPRKGKPKRKRKEQPWSYQFDYQAAKASSPFTFVNGDEKGKGKEKEKEKDRDKEREKEREREKGKEVEKAKSKGKSSRLSEPVKRRLSIDVLDISLLRPRAQASANDRELGRRPRFWDDSVTIDIAPTATVSEPTSPPPPPPPLPPAPSSSSSLPPVSPPTRTRTFKVRNP